MNEVNLREYLEDRFEWDRILVVEGDAPEIWCEVERGQVQSQIKSGDPRVAGPRRLTLCFFSPPRVLGLYLVRSCRG